MKILITSGPTREYIDAVRYLSNASTGRMGYALAMAAKAAGHEVTLVHGPTSHNPPRVDKTIAVTSALEMFQAVGDEFAACDALIACAAVSDYRPREKFSGKLKREAAKELTLELIQNPDIVQEMAARRRQQQVLIGFALEAESAEDYARDKLLRKRLDAIVLNTPMAIGSNETTITIFGADGHREGPISEDKSAAAKRIITLAEALLEHLRSLPPE
ncbi:MAG: phosphopantothenoylcysteine decarboxylase [Planctomycetes bacterium]|nr:phosphopantothenoylcysteine decarboxylase [Planctomycetota bacterium]